MSKTKVCGSPVESMFYLPATDVELLQWWTSLPCPKATQRDLWTAIILIFWCIWRHRNGARPDVVAIETRIREEHSRWHLARLFRSDSFGFPEPVPWLGGE
jgi:multisubunit Na+/H+ antiporter MnhE subunit